MARILAAFEVYELDAVDGSKDFIDGAMVKFYRASDDALLLTEFANDEGVMMPETFAGESATEPIYYIHTVASVDYRGGQGTSDNQDIIVSADPDADFTPAATVEPLYLELYAKPVGVEGAPFEKLGEFSRTSTPKIPNRFPANTEIEFAVVSVGSDGTRSRSRLDQAPSVTGENETLTAAPVIAQVGASEETNVQVEVTGFPLTTQARQVQVATNSTFTTGLSDNISTGTAAVSTSIFIGGTASSTRYVRVRHSSTGAAGPWSAWSNTLMITFANSGGGGGTTGDGNGYGGGEY